MNICLVTLEWPPYGGGIGTYMYNLSIGLLNLGHKVTVITHDNQPQQIDGIKIEKVPMPNALGSLKRKIYQWQWEPHHSWSLRAYQKFQNLKENFDILETAEYGAWVRHFIGKINAPIVVRCHSPAQINQEIPLNGHAWKMPLWLRFENNRERQQTNQADAISTPSFVLSNHISLSWSIAQSRIKVLPNPVDTKLFCPSKSQNGKKKEILYVGRLQYNKGVFDLINAVTPLFEEHSDLTVRLIGKDMKAPKHITHLNKMASEEIMERLPQRNRHQVIFDGSVPFAELIYHQENVMQNAICAVVPSRGFESFSYTLIEHMACGSAVIASHCGGPTEIINDREDGLLVPAGDIAALTNAMRKLITNPSLCVELGSRARRKVEEKYSISAVVPKIADWYLEIIGKYKNDKLRNQNI